jgi:hypothetical protein
MSNTSIASYNITCKLFKFLIAYSKVNITYNYTILQDNIQKTRCFFNSKNNNTDLQLIYTLKPLSTRHFWSLKLCPLFRNVYYLEQWFSTFLTMQHTSSPTKFSWHTNPYIMWIILYIYIYMYTIYSLLY